MLRSASLVILGAWVGLGVMFVGVGLLVCRAVRSAVEGADGWFLAFWLGWVGVLFALQLWHLALPVDARALALTAGAGLIGLVLHGVARAGRTRRPSGVVARGVAAHWLLLAVLTLVAVWLSNRAVDGPHHGDTGAYFIPTVRWLIEYPLVRGLGNLYVPLAFNQSHFLYVAMLDVGPFAHRSYHIANGLLILALLARAFLGVYRLVRWRRPCAPADTFYALFLPVAVNLALGIFLTSPSPDLPVFVLGVVVSGQLLTLLARPEPRPASNLDVIAIALLAAGGVTVKLSFAALAGVIVPLALFTSLIRERPGLAGGMRTLVGVGLVVACGMVPWVIRNVLLSGCPFYPSTFGALPVEWRVQADAVEWIKAPMRGGPVWSGLGDPRWFRTRLDSLGWLSIEVLLPTGIALAASVVGIIALCVRLFQRRVSAIRRSPVLILLPTVASLVFVGGMAPMPRYAGSSFWLLAVQTLLLVMGCTAIGERAVSRWLTGAAVLVAAGVMLFRDGPVLGDVTEFQPLPGPLVSEARLPSGLVVWVPEYGQCWEAPLPCTPSPDPALRLRRAGDLGSGFTVDAGARR